MSRATERHLARAIAAAAAVLAAGIMPCMGQGVPGESNTAIETYLESKGLKALLAEHLWQRMRTASNDDKPAIVERLGKLYVDLLGTANDADREHWQERARELVHAAPEGQTFELRLNLARAQYLRIEEQAEKVRLGLLDPEQVGEVDRQMRACKIELEKIAADVARRIEVLERVDLPNKSPEKLQEELSDGRRLRSMAFYYAGWAGYYQGLLADSPSAATDALRSFGWLLGRAGPNAGKEPPDLSRVAKGAFKYDHVARAGIGVALCHSLIGAHSEAVRWLDAIEADGDLPAAVRETLLVRRITVLARADRWEDLRVVIDRARRDDRASTPVALPTIAARLLTVESLKAQTKTPREDLARLAQLAMGDLVARGEVAHVLDLAQRYGTAPLGDTGFIVHYVRGVQAYDKAVAEHRKTAEDLDEPPKDAAIVNQYRQAADLLDLAMKQSDANRFGQPLMRTAVLAGRALFHAGQFGLAADRFIQARTFAENAKDVAASEEHLWLAVVALDKGSRGIGVESAQFGSRADELTALFLKTYPRSSRAATLVLRRGESGGIQDHQAVEILLTVQRDDPAFEASRRQAARLLYRIFRAAPSESRGYAASRFVPLGEEVMALDRRLAVGSEAKVGADAMARLVTTARQLLDALLSVQNPDVVRAQQVMTALRGVAEFNASSLASVEDELEFRRFQIALFKGESAEAQRLADELANWTQRPGNAGKPSRFSVSAQRALYLRAVETWRRNIKRVQPGEDLVQSISDESLAQAKDVVKFGRRVIDQLAQGPNTINEPGVVTLYASVAAAALDVYRRTGERDSLTLSVELDRKVLAAQPLSADSLRRLAESAELAADEAEALRCWATLAGGYETGTAAYCQAKYNAIRLESKTNKQAAAQAIDQHAVLFPQFGPPPWGSKLRQLHTDLLPYLPANTPAPNGGTAP